MLRQPFENPATCAAFFRSLEKPLGRHSHGRSAAVTGQLFANTQVFKWKVPKLLERRRQAKVSRTARTSKVCDRIGRSKEGVPGQKLASQRRPT